MLSNRRNAWQRGQASLSLIGTLVSLTIVIILSAWYAMKVLKPAAGSHNGAPASEQAAYGAVCSEYQSQISQAIMMYKQEHNDRNPTSFEQLKKYGATDDIIRAKGCQFQLDAGAGTVTEIGHGMAAPNAQPVVVNAGSSAPGNSSAPGASTPGPGGVTLPPAAGGSAAPSGTGDEGSQ